MTTASSTPAPAPRERYLGDGLYATFDGYQIILRTDRFGVEHWVALEPAVLESLLKFAEQIYSCKITIETPEE